MKISVKYYLLLCVVALAVICSAGSFILLICFGNKLTSFGWIALTVLVVINAILAILLKPILQIKREEYAAYKKSIGKSYSYNKLSMQERRRIEKENILKEEKLLSTLEYKNTLRKGSDNPDQDLNQLIGLSELKKEIFKFEYALNKNALNLHMCFLGNPGTGKTTMAAIITGLLYRYKYIKENEYIYVDGNFFKSSSDPIERTKLLLVKAKKKVLFIDEAYALVQGNYSLGQQIIATLLNEMENNRTDLIIILAGYQKEMKQLFLSNSGLASRVKNYFVFEDYNLIELQNIFTQMVYKNQLAISSNALEKFTDLIEKEKKKSSFANARTVRNIVENALLEHQYNLKNNLISTPYMLQPEDIVNTKKSPF